MTRRTRGIWAALIAAVSFGSTIIMGAPAAAALLALLGGAVAMMLAFPIEQRDGPPAEAAPIATTEPPLPDLRALLAAVEDPLLIVRDRRILAANVAAFSLLGDEIVGSDVRLAIRHPAAAERLSPTAPGSKEDVSRIELSGVGDPDRIWQMIVTPLGDGSRLVRLTDQSEARATEQMRVDFVANASHELRTPLATLLGFLETLEDEDAGGDKATRNRFLKIMSREASRMRDLVDDLMSLSRIEADRFTIPREPIDLAGVLESVRDGCRIFADQRKIVVTVERETEETRVAGDRSQLVQMFSNLLTNALKYGRDGGIVKLRLEAAGPTLLRVTVADNGEGIKAEHIPRLTERFYRVDPGRSRAAGGTGLGLAIVKHIALRHRGRLEISSQVGEGTCVTILLPAWDGGGEQALV